MPQHKEPARVEESPPDELADEQIVELPPRDALSIVDPGILGAGTPIPIRPLDPVPPDTADANPPSA